ncbi:MAG: YbaB/EbfC family nucleoid-associated protein [Bdellovibrionales bacterium]|nr:YbaB/EbfC family nucleoid-associated protein [Bdellovibrionales bacterium]
MNKGFKQGGSLDKLMKQAQKMQVNLQKAQDVARTFKADGTSGGGAVKVVATGENLIESIKIRKDAVDPSDVEILEEMILAAANEALKNVQIKVENELSKVTGGLNIPGLT